MRNLYCLKGLTKLHGKKLNLYPSTAWKELRRRGFKKIKAKEGHYFKYIAKDERVHIIKRQDGYYYHIDLH